MSPTSLPPEPNRSREELLGIVRTRATVLRRRRRAAIGGAMALVLAVLGGGIAVSQGLSGPSVRVTAGQGNDGSTTTTTSAPETTTSSSPLGAAETTSTTRPKGGPSSSTTSPRPLVTATTVPADSTTTTTTSDAAPECRNSTDPRCGPFRWEPEPTKHPLTVDVSVLTADPVAGKPVQFKVIVDEKDTTIAGNCYGYSGTGIEGRPTCMPTYPACVDQSTAYGPWAPPEQMPDRYEMTQSFTYDKAGTYTLSFTFNTGWPGCFPWSPRDPYANSGTGTVTFTVRPPAEGEGTTTSSSATSTTRKPG